MPTLNEQVIEVVDNLNRDSANVDIWVNGDNTATYQATGGEFVPSIQKLVQDFETRTDYVGDYQSGGTPYIRGQSFTEAYAAYLVTDDFTSTTFGGDAASYKIAFDLTTIVQVAIDAADAAAESETSAAASAAGAQAAVDQALADAGAYTADNSSTDIDAFMGSADNAAARTLLGITPTPIADLAALYALTGLTGGERYETPEGGIYRYLGGGESLSTSWAVESRPQTSEFIDALLQQPSKRFVQDLLSVPLPFAAFVHTLSQEQWRKAAKFTSTKPTAISVFGNIRSSTGYIKCLDHDGTWEAVVGSVDPTSDIAPNFTASGDNIPRFYAIIPCDDQGNLDGDLTYLDLQNNQLTSFDVTGLSALTYLGIVNNQLTSFDGTGLSALTSLSLVNNQLTSFDGTGLSSLTSLSLNGNHLTSFDGTGLSILDSLSITNNQLTSFDGTGLSALSELSIQHNQLTSFDGTGLSAMTVLTIQYNQLTSFIVGDLMTEDLYTLFQALPLQDQQLDAAAIQQIYEDVPDGDSYGTYSNTINVTGNPGAGAGSGTDPSVATAKGWTVDGDSA